MEDLETENNEPRPSTSGIVGRPRLSYTEKSERSKRREATVLSKEHQEPLLMLQAAKISARQQGDTDLVAVIKEITKSPARATKVRKVLLSPKKEHLQYSVEEALELILSSNLSKQQYSDIRQGARIKNCNMYPDYNKLVCYKQYCRPDRISTSDVEAKVPLRSLLEHTAKRIVLMQSEVILEAMGSTDELNAEMILSYGFDGSSGQSAYKQKYDTPGKQSDSALFATTVIPLRLCANRIVLWNNRTPQSVRFCRPVKLAFAKETRDYIFKEKESLNKEITKLTDIKVSLVENKYIIVKFNLFMTLIDGKVLNVLTNTKSSQMCPICGATPRNFMDIKNLKAKTFEPKPDTLKYGISPLHSWIRFFECIVHIGYRLDLCVWQIRGSQNKHAVNNRKKHIQDRFWSEMNLHVDKPKPNGCGSTNDGNTARRAFSNPHLFANITNVDEALIKKFRIILIALSCSLEIHPKKFEELCNETAKLYFEKYAWYPMPASVHKVLVHGNLIIENTILPIGCFSEEASEARNKLYKYDRLHHARKSSRQNNLLDVFNRAMDTSDPIISTINLTKRIKKQRQLKLPTEVLNVLKEPDIQVENTPADEVEHEGSENEDLDDIFNIQVIDKLILENED